MYAAVGLFHVVEIFINFLKGQTQIIWTCSKVVQLVTNRMLHTKFELKLSQRVHLLLQCIRTQNKTKCNYKKIIVKIKKSIK